MSLLNKSINCASSTESRIGVNVICLSSRMLDVWDASSSVPLVIPAFLKPFLMDKNFTASQARTTQSQTLAWVALLIFLVSVKVWIPSDFHLPRANKNLFVMQLIMREINSSWHQVFVLLCGTFITIKFIWEVETQVGDKFFQFNFQKNLKLSCNPHLPITRSGARLMQNQQITCGLMTGNYGSKGYIENPVLCNIIEVNDWLQLDVTQEDDSDSVRFSWLGITETARQIIIITTGLEYFIALISSCQEMNLNQLFNLLPVPSFWMHNVMKVTKPCSKATERRAS